MLLSVIVEPV
jgi:hypothetical protein